VIALEMLAIGIAYLLTLRIGLIAAYGVFTVWAAILGLWDGRKARRNERAVG
jgi:hypothetical protein